MRHAHVLSALSLRRPDVSRSLALSFVCGTEGMYYYAEILFLRQTAQYYPVQQLLIATYLFC